MFVVLPSYDNAKMYPTHAVTLVLLLSIFITSTWTRYIGPEDHITGAIKICSNEGEEVEMELVNQNPCFHCICRGGRVECDYGACPSLKGCHAILFMRTPGACCDQCKGCSVNGTEIAHGEIRTSTRDPCEVMTCQAGVLTKARDMCEPPCSNPYPVPGQCCPSCKGCFFEGTTYKDGQTFVSKLDQDLTCSCVRGSITCSKRVCPVLNCPTEYMHKVPGDKCPKCKGQRRVYTLRESCYFARQVYNDGDVTMTDSCTSCVCQKGTMLCERQQCPDIRCPPSERIITPGECCPKCRQRPSCISGGKVYQHGKKWKERHCTECMCDNGKKWCRAFTCPGIDKCPLGYRKVRKAGECCEKCVKDEKTCSVTGPRFNALKTLDGRRYSIPDPSCKYTLLKDCYQKDVDVKIRFKRKQGSAHASISHVFLKIGSNSLKLSSHFKIKVNKTTSITKRLSKSRTLLIRVDFPRVLVQDKSKGLRVIWNMHSGLKVKVDRRYRKSGRLCGLCGNYNGHKWDEFISANGKSLKTAMQMAKAWALKRTCTSTRRHPRITVSSAPTTVTRIPEGFNSSLSSGGNTTHSDTARLNTT